MQKMNIVNSNDYFHACDGQEYNEVQEMLHAQAKLTLSEVAPIVDKLFEALSHADFSNGVEAFGVDEGRVRAWEHIKQLEDEWKALIK